VKAQLAIAYIANQLGLNIFSPRSVGLPETAAAAAAASSSQNAARAKAKGIPNQ
jgi:hypothetical protein